MSYIVIRSFYEGDTLHEQGQTFQHEDAEYVQKCLADENIADSENPEAAKLVAEAEKVAAVAQANTEFHESIQPAIEAQPAVETVQTTETTQEQQPPTQEGGQERSRLFGLV